MEILSPQLDLDFFFAHITKAQERLLLLDYDGTLAPFRVERDQAFPYQGVTELLSDIRDSQTTRLIIISGRAIQDLVPLIDIDPLPEIWGSHGWEYLSSDGKYTIVYPDEATRNIISQAKECISLLNLENHCEQKPVSLAIHWRGLTPETAESIQAQVLAHWTKLIEKSSLKIQPFDGGIEP
ncbi:trehalose-phosphatase [Nostoc sp. CCY0012]|uniref:trehalose-phosphatase n=1 Tax=Nostoc sp. CCY0012 TaxID=1056123 RepID=UPI0039C75F3E